MSSGNWLGFSKLPMWTIFCDTLQDSGKSFFFLVILVMHEAFAELICFSIVFERLIFGLVEWFLNNLGSTCGYQYILRLSIHVINKTASPGQAESVAESLIRMAGTWQYQNAQRISHVQTRLPMHLTYISGVFEGRELSEFSSWS